MVLGKLPVPPGRPRILIKVGQGPIAVGAGGGGLDIFLLSSVLSPLTPSPWETARYRLKYCLKGPLNSKQPKNQQILLVLKILFTQDFEVDPCPVMLLPAMNLTCSSAIISSARV